MHITEIDENFWQLLEKIAPKQVPSTYLSKTGKQKPVPNPLPQKQFNQLLAKTKRDKLRRLAALQQAQQLNTAGTKTTELDIVRAMNLNADL